MSLGHTLEQPGSSWLPVHDGQAASALYTVPECTDRRLLVDRIQPRKKAEVWAQGISELFTDLSPDISDPDAFTASIDTIYRHDISISHIAAGAQRVHRRASDSCGRRIDRYFLNVQLEGTSRVRHANGLTELRAGDCVLVDPNDAYVLDFSTPFRQLCLQLPDWWLGGRLEVAPRQFIARPIPMGQGSGMVLCSTLKAIISSPHEDGETPELIDLFGEVLGRTLRIGSRAQGERPLASGERATFERLAAYLHRRFRDETIDPGQAAEALGCSVRYVHKVCASHGTTFRRLLIDTRLSAAAHRLLSDDPSARIATICYDCGFADISHFNRMFRRKFGLTPREYRSAR